MKARQLAYLDALGIESYEPKANARRPGANVSATADKGAAGASELDSLDWTTLRARIAACTACELHRTRTQTVFGVGDPHAEWLIIGEAPGADEDRQGEPFVGRAGQLLNSMLRAVGLRREQVYIANILKCRPPGNRDPKPEEAQRCTRQLLRLQSSLHGKGIACTAFSNLRDKFVERSIHGPPPLLLLATAAGTRAGDPQRVLIL